MARMPTPLQPRLRHGGAEKNGIKREKTTARVERRQEEEEGVEGKSTKKIRK